MAVTVGFEPTVGGYPTQLFESCTFGRSDTSPPKSLRHDGRGRESMRHAPHAHPQQCRLHSSLPAAPAISSTARSGSSMPKVGCRIRPHFRAGCAGTRWAERRRFVSPSARSATEGTLPLALREKGYCGSLSDRRGALVSPAARSATSRVQRPRTISTSPTHQTEAISACVLNRSSVVPAGARPMPRPRRRPGGGPNRGTTRSRQAVAGRRAARSRRRRPARSAQPTRLGPWRLGAPRCPRAASRARAPGALVSFAGIRNRMPQPDAEPAAVTTSE